jgi:hypothetical protein
VQRRQLDLEDRDSDLSFLLFLFLLVLLLTTWNAAPNPFLVKARGILLIEAGK